MQLLGGPTCGGCTTDLPRLVFEGLSMFRRLRVLAAFLLVPLVLFSNPSTASAATSGTLTFQLDGATCVVGWARTATGLSIGSSSRCDSGPDFSPFSGQAYEGTTGAYGFVLKDVGGATCGSAGLAARDVEGNDVTSVAAGIGPAFVPVADWTDCVPVQACLSYYWDGPGWSDTDTVDCVAFTVDPPPPPWAPPVEMPWGDCKHGYPFGVSYRHVTTYESTLQPPTTMYKDKWRVGFENRPQPPLMNGAEWVLKGAHNPKGSIAPTTHLTDTDGTNPPSSNPQWVNKDLWINDPTALSGSHNKTDGEVWGVQITTKDPALSTANIPIGYTNPGKCTFWFGPKIRTGEHPTYGDDDPWAPLIDEGAPVEPDPEPPTVQVPTGPVDANTGFLGGLLEVLRQILGLLRDLVTGLLQLFKDLFIPSRGFLDDAFSDLSDAWQGTTVVQFLDVFDGFDTGEVIGCGGVRMQFEMPGASNYVIDERLGAACDGPMAQTASIVRAVVTAVVFVTGGMACVRGIGAGFGWRPSFGRVDDA